MSRRQDMMRGAAAPPPEEYYEPTQAPAAAPVEDDPYEKLKEAKKLLDAGILTQEEFEAEKKKILG